MFKFQKDFHDRFKYFNLIHEWFKPMRENLNFIQMYKIAGFKKCKFDSLDRDLRDVIPVGWP